MAGPAAALRPGGGAGSRGLAAVVALVVGGLAAALRVHGMTFEGLWFDEGHSLLMAQASPREAVAALAGDVHPPLYFLLLGAWTRLFGESDAALRSLSVVLGTASVLAFGALGRRVGGVVAGVAAALLAAASPFHVRYAQEVRPYALLLLLSVLATTALLRLADRPGSVGRRLAYGVAAAALLYTHANALFVLLAHAAWGVARALRPAEGRSDGFLRAATFSAAVAAVLFAPWVPTVWAQATEVAADGWIPRPTPRIVYRALFAHAGGEPGFAALAVLAAAGLVRPRPASVPPHARLLAGLLFAVPLAGPVLLSLVGPSVFLPRTAIASSAGLFLLAAQGAASLADGVRRAGWSRAPGGARAAAVAAAALVALALGVGARTLLRQYRKPHNAQVREAMEVVNARAQPGDGVSIGHEFERAVLEHYLRRGDLTVFDRRDVPPQVRRAWVLVTIHERRPDRATEPLEAAGFRPAGSERFHRLELRRLERP